MTHIQGLTGGAFALEIAKLIEPDKKYLIITKDEAAAELLSGDLRLFFDPKKVFHYLNWDILPFEQGSPSLHVSANRILTRINFNSSNSGVFISNIQTLAKKEINLDLLDKLTFSIKKNENFSLNELKRKLEILGFTRTSMVQNLGEFSAQGQVIDFFPSNQKTPVRVQITRNKIDNVKLFKTEDQRTYIEIDKITIYPIREYCPFTKGSPLEDQLNDALRGLERGSKANDVPLRERKLFEEDIEKEDYFNSAEAIFPLVSTSSNPLIDELKNIDEIIIFDELGIKLEFEDFQNLIRERAELTKTRQIIMPLVTQTFSNEDSVKEFIDKHNKTYFDTLEVNTENKAKINELISHTCFSNSELKILLSKQIGSGNAYEPLKKWLTSFIDKSYKVGFFVGSELRAKQLSRILTELDLDSEVIPNENPIHWIQKKHRVKLAIFIGHLSSGFNLVKDKLVFISESEIFLTRSKKTANLKKENIQLKKIMESLSKLEAGDYIVHEDYGIGIYQGLQLKKIEDEESDFLQIDYADSNLFLPIQHIGKIQKYRSKEGLEPELNKLSSKKWEKTKKKVKDHLVALAGDLIKLYAERENAKGWRFEPYGAEDERFALEFPFNETTDQLNAIEATIEDMSKDKPMDRLVCGDVGFGKTEVAIRASFKALQHARQVAVLVPTTILVEQHYQTFSERFKNYPYEIRALSRFYKNSENKETLERIQSGQCDLVIGTHKLLASSVEFRDLGLLVVDEEQRFGVKQKERLKQLKKDVDVLTLTATPIPRTMHMALLNIRDVSVITTPPTNRLNVKTYVATRSESLIREAILRELKRQGQVFFLHNRIESIEIILAGLTELVPEARFVFAHGQMPESKLEQIMSGFIRKEFDVLLSTSIIESGIDIPNANTMIIDRSDMFGLAQLYQLRGRVGRSDRQAYCYFLVPSRKKMSEDAKRRLNVMQSINSLGQGFQLALRDLEIRGAGNLLGKEQAGNVISVGFELYTKILNEAVLNLKGEETKIIDTIDPDVKLGVPAFIPDVYIPDVSERLILYQRLANLVSEDEASDLELEINDRYGPVSLEVENLIEIMKIRGLLRQFGITKLEKRGEKLLVSFYKKAPLDLKKLLQTVKLKPKKYKLGNSLSLTINLTQKQEANILNNLYIDLLGLFRSIAA